MWISVLPPLCELGETVDDRHGADVMALQRFGIRSPVAYGLAHDSCRSHDLPDVRRSDGTASECLVHKRVTRVEEAGVAVIRMLVAFGSIEPKALARRSEASKLEIRDLPELLDPRVEQLGAMLDAELGGGGHVPSLVDLFE